MTGALALRTYISVGPPPEETKKGAIPKQASRQNMEEVSQASER